MSLNHLKVGDRVLRMLGGDINFMEMEVVKVHETTIECAHVVNGHLVKMGWQFDRNSGAEEDDDLKWGVKYGRTGSYLKEKS